MPDAYDFDRLCAHSAGPIGVGVSGGSDSLALLVLAADWAKASGRELLALTFDHCLRPEAADEAIYVASICADLEIAHQTIVWDSPARQSATARRARHAGLAEALRAAGGNHLLLGHTLDDQYETFLLRLRQGSGWYGLGGIQPLAVSPVQPEGAGVTLVRPLLKTPREHLRNHLRTRSLHWVDDPTNSNEHYERVQMRGQLAADPALRARVAVCAASFEALRAIEDTLIGGWMSAHVRVEGRRIDADFSALPKERAARALGLLLQIVGRRERPPRMDNLARMIARLQAERAFTGATLGGVKLTRNGAMTALRPEHNIVRNSGDSVQFDAQISGIRHVLRPVSATIAAL